MTISPLEEQQQRQPNWQSLTTEQKSRMLCLLVEQDQGARIYFNIEEVISASSEPPETAAFHYSTNWRLLEASEVSSLL
jgi:hypothetical protein